VKFLLSLIAAASSQTAHSLCHRFNRDGYRGTSPPIKIKGARQISKGIS
jgi:hypothetical protein